MEIDLLSVALRSRPSFEKIYRYIELKEYSREFQVVMQYIRDYYNRDSQADSVVPALLLGHLSARIDSEKLLLRYKDLIEQGAALDTSTLNVEAVVIDAKRFELGNALAVALVNKNSSLANDLMEEWKRLQHVETLDELAGRGIDIIQNIDPEKIFSAEERASVLLRTYPLSLANAIGGGMEPGDHMILFARPETGKSAAAMTLACGFANQGAPGIYLTNEDRTSRIAARLVCNLSGMSRSAAERDPLRARSRAYDNGLGEISLVSMSPGTMSQVRSLMDRLKPRWLILDQLRNMRVDNSQGNRVAELEALATEARNLTKAYDLVTVSVTQAGATATDKLVLEMGDVDGSKTGIPGQADVMLGVGVNAQYEAEGLRMYSLPKNKLGDGEHVHFPVKLNKALSKLESI